MFEQKHIDAVLLVSDSTWTQRLAVALSWWVTPTAAFCRDSFQEVTLTNQTSHHDMRIGLKKDQWSSRKSPVNNNRLLIAWRWLCIHGYSEQLKLKIKRGRYQVQEKRFRTSHSKTFLKNTKGRGRPGYYLCHWHRILPFIFAQTAHYAWLRAARPSKLLWTSHCSWQFCKVQFCAKTVWK